MIIVVTTVLCIYLLKQLTKEYPDILTPENIWITGITQVPSTREYYLVFYHKICQILDRFIRNNKRVKYMQYSDFYELNEIGSGGLEKFILPNIETI